MASKIFVNYRRDDDPNGAARVRDGLAAKFGKPNVFMDVDNLLAGQRFDEELAKALSQCDVLVAVIGPRWMELLKSRASSAERDYVREEIATALRPEIEVSSVRVGDQPPRPSRVVIRERLIVIPVRVGREGQLAPLPRAEDLPEDIRDLVLYQKHDVAHERFGRDIAELVEAIQSVRRTSRLQYAAPRVPWGWVAATAASVLAIGYAGAYYGGVPVTWPGAPLAETLSADAVSRSRAEDEMKAREADVERLRVAAAKAEPDRNRSEAEAAKLRTKTDARRKADEDALAMATAEAEAKRKAGEEARPIPHLAQTFRDCKDGCPEMVIVPAGSFTMGSPASEEGHDAVEVPQRVVTIAFAFAVGKFEVSFAEWDACAAAGGCNGYRPLDAGWGRSSLPVIRVSWFEAQAYVEWLRKKTSRPYRLLSEAEWEYMARAGTAGPFWWGNSVRPEQANYNSSDAFGSYAGSPRAPSKQRTMPVSSYAPNPFGIYNVHGNVSEWVSDCSSSDYKDAPTDGSARKFAKCTPGMHRGGAWSSGPIAMRSANRGWYDPQNRARDIGIRVALSLTP